MSSNKFSEEKLRSNAFSKALILILVVALQALKGFIKKIQVQKSQQDLVSQDEDRSMSTYETGDYAGEDRRKRKQVALQGKKNL